jgi:hypothetical protein
VSRGFQSPDGNVVRTKDEDPMALLARGVVSPLRDQPRAQTLDADVFSEDIDQALSFQQLTGIAQRYTRFQDEDGVGGDAQLRSWSCTCWT